MKGYILIESDPIHETSEVIGVYECRRDAEDDIKKAVKNAGGGSTAEQCWRVEEHELIRQRRP